MNIWRTVGRHAEENFILASLILLILFFGFSSDNFFSVITLTTILNQLPALTFVTVGMTLVLIVAGIDLSVGSVMGFCAAVVGVAAVTWGLPLWMACLMGLGAGLIRVHRLADSVTGIAAARHWRISGINFRHRAGDCSAVRFDEDGAGSLPGCNRHQ
jgi:ABC-type xylose transport system permease subunit